MAARPLTAAMIRQAGRAPAAPGRGLASLIAGLAEALAAAFAELSEAPAKVEADGIASETRSDWPPGAVTVRLVAESGPLTAVIQADRGLAMGLAEAAFGGTGTEPPHDGAERPLSPAETRLRGALLQSFASRFPDVLTRCFSRPFNVAPEERNPPAAEKQERRFIAARLLIHIFGYCGEVTVSLPEGEAVALMQPVRRDVMAAAGQREKFRRALERAEISVTAALPPETMTLGQVAGLKPGQLLKLAAAAGAPIHLMAEGHPLRHARLLPGGDGLRVEIIGP